MGFNAKKSDKRNDEICEKKDVSIKGKNIGRTTLLSIKCMFDLTN